MSRKDRVRYWAFGALRVLWNLSIIGFAVWAIVSSNTRDDRAVERDAARTYQRCKQVEPIAIVAQLGLDRSPHLRAEIQRKRPDLLDENGHLPVPDCERTYPLGAAVSHRYPDLTPTKPAP
ncbi:hypothetical protein [Patulibacter sp. SYSU D01012]|uniref:hypothetical protein n=1 Tax=Patulibacter sp. SYSU D01012 TaxID=2817381 RepID=UPI001B30DAA8|nr:hypothetical protein [Patulibacter sp. SYSU D01012]